MAITFSTRASREMGVAGAGVTAVLGPTNTGKTHLAIERMLAHSSGIIGLPLRLLAREVYNKIVDRIGPESVALITGEEKIKPARPRFWVSTVEAMPRDLDVSFVAIDEIQLAGDLERGHVFTDRVLNRRGRDETLILGAQTVRPLVEKLLPGAHILSRPRLSQLTHAGDRKLTRLPRRSAIVVFSADEVYAIGELIRRQRGGVAVVLGSLSPRTRNAQVALYQAGEVDYLVATDAIGMGLNLDVDHVAFASDRKFDGYQFRKLNTSELAQIAGRAGRATRDGTFGTTGRCEPFEPEVVRALEAHSFEPLKQMQWRNAELNFSSIGALQASLAQVPTAPGLTRAPVAEDITVLDHAARDDDIRALARSPAAVERLWEVCQVPDYRKVSPSAHTELVLTLYGYLMRERVLPTDWFARQIAFADRTDGDIDTLSNRIAHIRTWTFIANRPDWLADPEHWQDLTRGVEDKLSDALHERLLHRFVDRRTSVLMRRLRENVMLETEITRTGDVLVEGHPLGRLEGFRFAADAGAAGPEGKALRAAAQKGLAGEIGARATRLGAAGDDQFVLASDGVLRWLGDPVGKLAAGETALRPSVRIIADEQLAGAARDTVQARLELWLKAHIEKLLGPLVALAATPDVTGIARGIAFQLTEALGVLERQVVADDVRSLDQEARAQLRNHGVRFGAYHIYMPPLLKPAPRVLAAQLWAVKQGDADVKGLSELPALAASGRTSMPVDKAVDKALYRTIGYRVCGERAVRVDILERLADLIRPALAWRPNGPGSKPPGAVDGRSFAVTASMTSLVGSSGEDFASILRSLGYRLERRPKPVEEPRAAVAVPEQDAPPAETFGEVHGAGNADQTTVTPPADAEPVPALVSEGAAEPAAKIADLAQTAGHRPDAEAVGAPVEAPLGPTEPAAVAEPAEAVPDGTEVSAPAAENTPAVAESGSAAAAPAAPEPEMIEVWRPGGRSDERRAAPRRSDAERVPRRHGRHGRDQTAPVGDAPTVAAGDGEQPALSEGRPWRRPSGSSHAAPPEAPAPGGAERPQRRQFGRDQAGRERSREPGGERSEHGGKGGGKHGAPRHRSGGQDRRGERREDAGARASGEREWSSAPALSAKERRDRPPDPDSPFAKLLALKAQLEGGGKPGT